MTSPEIKANTTYPAYNLHLFTKPRSESFLSPLHKRLQIGNPSFLSSLPSSSFMFLRHNNIIIVFLPTTWSSNNKESTCCIVLVTLTKRKKAQDPRNLLLPTSSISQYLISSIWMPLCIARNCSHKYYYTHNGSPTAHPWNQRETKINKQNPPQ